MFKFFPSFFNLEFILKNFRVFFFTGLMIVSLNAKAQIDTVNMDSDELFKLAKEEAFSGKRENARKLCAMILEKSPGYIDARVLIGRTFSWDGKYSKAKSELQEALKQKPQYEDALNALLDVLLWSDDYNDALKTAEEALDINPTNEDFLLKKAKALIKLDRSEESGTTLAKLLNINPSNTDALKLQEEIKTGALNNSISVNYSIDYFTKAYDPMHYAHVQYSRSTKYGSIIGRLNYSYRFESHGIQPEIDLYPRIIKGVYAYLNYGYSTSSLFPLHRSGAEIYTKLPFSFEASLGFRYLYYDKTSDVIIYTGSIGYYFKSYWLSLRPYLTPNDAGVSKSLYFTARKYLADAENYFSLTFGGGFSPDARRFLSNTGFAGEEIFYLKSQRIGIGLQKSLGRQFYLSTSLDFTNQELSFDPGAFTSIYSFQLGLRKRW